jgi:hypothetical protein
MPNTETNITPETATAPVNPEPTQAKPATKKQPTKKKAAPKPKTVKAKPAPKAKKPVKTAKPEIKLRPDGLREDSAGGLLVDTVCRKQGATHAELVEALGWPGGQCLPYLVRVCAKAGVRLKKERKPGEAMRYYGVVRKSR